VSGHPFFAIEEVETATPIGNYERTSALDLGQQGVKVQAQPSCQNGPGVFPETHRTDFAAIKWPWLILSLPMCSQYKSKSVSATLIGVHDLW